MKHLLPLLIALFALSAQAQTFKFSVKGTIVEEGTKDALPTVKVQLLTTDSVRESHATTNEHGAFLLKAKKAGKYIVCAEMVGFETLYQNVEFTSKKTAIDLGTLTLTAQSYQLEEAQVTALSRMMTVKADTLLFNTKALRLPPNASLAAMMKELPGISIDKDGNLTFQGKTVSQILVDGKPFFGDVSTALANMPTDAVKDVKMYEKTDEEKEFRGELDTDKATVVDLTIKEEYKSTWMANIDLGGGTNERYIGKVFTTNFTDRRRTAIYAQVNNISQNQQVDENGNWYYYGGLNGLYTYRKAGAMMQWDNGKGNKEAGNLRVNGDINLSHNDQTSIRTSSNETFLGGGKSLFSYGNSVAKSHRMSADAKAAITYNIDSLNRIYVNARYGYNMSDSRNSHLTSTYQELPNASDNLAGSLLEENLPDAVKQQAVTAQRGSGLSAYDNHTARFTANYTHIFKKTGRTFDFYLNGSYNTSGNEDDVLQYFRYFRPDAPKAELTNRQFTDNPSESYYLSGELNYAEPLSKHLKLRASYNFTHDKNDGKKHLYQLDRYDVYRNPHLPVGFRPTTGDSLEFVRNVENSLYGDAFRNDHRIGTRLQGTWDKVETAFSPSVSLRNERLYVQKGNDFYAPNRTVAHWNIFGMVKYKFNPQNYMQLNYSGSTSRPSLQELLPIHDTSDPMSETVNNPNLKTGWYNNFYFSSSFFNKKRGDSYSLYGGFDNTTRQVVTTSQVDPTTGFTRYSKMNTDGRYAAWASFGTEQPLDTARHWTLTSSIYLRHDHSTGYVGAMGNDLGLSSINDFNATARFGLRFRKDIWSVSLNGMWDGSFTRYKETPQYNQDGHTYEVILTPQVDLPFGMKINSTLIYYTRTGFADELMNHDQWIVNASISQTFLKDKSLTLQLEVTDLLKERTAEFSHLSATSRTFSRTECFLSYVMLHAIYRLNLGGKK